MQQSATVLRAVPLVHSSCIVRVFPLHHAQTKQLRDAIGNMQIQLRDAAYDTYTTINHQLAMLACHIFVN